ncbi:amino acid ABC transporter substrate-binding protein, PAAT family [Desulfocicer vacuolatum DSM 3385]|uniref:Amino acid ABC transporter substrate-binding protein, PAAT family n=1 Tax=Desulfocicer vacuolatum DSM 3385 TaxID=1121400 RepID=A0A1W2BZD6_9BACT|nr:transporter substrate-binding domain-containing protein [Desulfocicer vacuolatum]SMC78176.1 amino acid ABC transporter substrate-binding protein, PAAT family [Desulfocicer vacuolatum DSM 3385]
MKKSIFWIIALSLFCCYHSAFADQNTETDLIVNVCDDEALWPPYLFLVEKNGEKIPQGAFIDVLDALSRETGFTFKLTLCPWKRCLQEVKDYGKNGKFEIFNGSWNESRAKDYWMTSPIYFTTASYWYSKKQFPDGPNIKKADDLKKYKVLGVHGYSYSDYHYCDKDEFIGIGGIDKSARDLKTAFEMLRAGRGDILLVNAAVPIGYKYTGEDILFEEVTFQRLPGAKSGGFPIYISKESPRALELLSKINQAVINLVERGVIEKIMKKYLPCGRDC